MPTFPLSRLRILSAIHPPPPETTRAILEHLGLPSRAPPLAPAPNDDESFYDDAPDGAEIRRVPLEDPG